MPTPEICLLVIGRRSLAPEGLKNYNSREETSSTSQKMAHKGLKPYGNVFPVFSLCGNSKEDHGDCHFTPAKTAIAKTQNDCAGEDVEPPGFLPRTG